MARTRYFKPKLHRTAKNLEILKFIPASKSEAYKADRAEQILSEGKYVYYLALVLVYRAYYLLSERHQKHIRSLVDAGILDELVIYSMAELTNSFQ